MKNHGIIAAIFTALILTCGVARAAPQSQGEKEQDAAYAKELEIRDLRILRQRQVADLMGQFFAALA